MAIEAYKQTFDYKIPGQIVLTKRSIHAALREVQTMLRTHQINGGPRKLRMEFICENINTCKTAACIGGWVAIVLTGTEHASVADQLFSTLHVLEPRLHALFHDYVNTNKFNDPAVAAQAIERYFNKRIDYHDIWPDGDMPGVKAPRKIAKKVAKKRARR